MSIFQENTKEIKEEPEEEDESSDEEEETKGDRRGVAKATRSDRMAARNGGMKDENPPVSPKKGGSKPAVKKEEVTSPQR